MQVMGEETFGPVMLRAVACECGALLCQSAFTLGCWRTEDADCWVTMGVTGLYSEDTLDELLEELHNGEPLEALHKLCAVLGQPWAELAAENHALEAALRRFVHLDPGLVESVPAEQCWAARRATAGSDPLRVVRALTLVAESYVDERPIAAGDAR